MNNEEQKSIIHYQLFIIHLPALQKKHTSSASGKIILSGEYAVVFGYRGIAIPSERRVHISFIQKQKNDASTIDWHDETANDHLREYAQKIALLITEKTGITGQFTIENHLPLGKGMGSSTAFVIAITKSALGDDCEQIAREIEDTVNPGNSGLDFTVIWHEKPVLFKRGSEPDFIDLPKNLLQGMTLIDTGTPNEPTPELVAWIRSKYPAAGTPGPGEPTKIFNAITSIGNCTERILKGEPIKDVMKDHHRAQVALGVVPEATQKIIAGIEKKGGVAKVIGAGAKTGGGGMVMVVP